MCLAMADTVLHPPNRDKAESKATRAVVILLLLTSALLIAVVTFGGWSQLQGAQIISIGYIIVYVVMAYFVTKWNRGVLPVAAGLAILFAVVAAVAGPAWFERDKAGWWPSRCAASNSSGASRSRSGATRPSATARATTRPAAPCSLRSQAT